MAIERVERDLTPEDEKEITLALEGLPPTPNPPEALRRQRRVTLVGVAVGLGLGLLVALWRRGQDDSPSNVRLAALAVTALVSLTVGFLARFWRDGVLFIWRLNQEWQKQAEALRQSGRVAVWQVSAEAAVACGEGFLVQAAPRELLFLSEPPHAAFELAEWPLKAYRALGLPLPILTPTVPIPEDAYEGDRFALSLAELLADPSRLESAYQGNLVEQVSVVP